ncbi:heavy metal translocating P-type ATPase [Turicibacter sp. TJ11]|uniref:heavy metal translocating P-type ATPase n=1 Tax=Turicibacter sp. TJ11 TaxID=2806443 RepID=UPI001F312B69|nr:heavy metal translocating P-type ATPase [Turicibacter sp. TJ11]
MENDKTFKLALLGLDCANCANKIEERVNRLSDVEEATLNFSTSRLTVSINDPQVKLEVIEEIKKIVEQLEPDVTVIENNSGEVLNQNQCCQGDCSRHDEQHLHKHASSHEHIVRELKVIEILKEQKNLLLGFVIFLIAVLFPLQQRVEIVLYLMSYLLIGGNVIGAFWRHIKRGEIFDENFLMTVATVGAFCIGEYPEAIAVMLFYEIGELFQSYAVNRSRHSITSLLDIRADHANLVTESSVEEVNPEVVSVGDYIIIKPGERVPLDGEIVEGQCYLDTSALTGESVPRLVSVGDPILSGCINTNALVKVRVTKVAGESTVARILELVENASSKKAQTERFITRFARVYTPIVVLLACLIAIIPPLVFQGNFSTWLYRALSFLVVSCPCALVVSIPLGFFAGLGGASKQGVLIKGGNYLETLTHADTVVFDKTGTLTKGVFKVIETHPVNMTEDTFIKFAAYAESQSNHPIAKSIVEAYGYSIDETVISSYEEVAGKGIKAVVNEQQILIGNATLMKEFSLEVLSVSATGTIIHMAVDQVYVGYIVIADEIKETSKAAISKLKQQGVSQVIMLTGDQERIAKQVAEELGVDRVYAELLPYQKVEHVEQLLANQSKNKSLVFVGDGMNDAPVLARADVGVAMGAIGSDAAIEAADVVLMEDDPMALVKAIDQAKQTKFILYQNIIFALGVKILVMILIAFGLATMWAAVFADVGVTVLAVINSTRALKSKK